MRGKAQHKLAALQLVRWTVRNIAASTNTTCWRVYEARSVCAFTAVVAAGRYQARKLKACVYSCPCTACSVAPAIVGSSAIPFSCSISVNTGEVADGNALLAVEIALAHGKAVGDLAHLAPLDEAHLENVVQEPFRRREVLFPSGADVRLPVPTPAAAPSWGRRPRG